MPLNELTEHERRIVFECLRAASEGPFFEDQEFHRLLGLERLEVAEILSSWPDVDEGDQAVQLAINNAMNNLVGYPHRCEDVWADYVSVPRHEVHRILWKWKGSDGSRYFDGMM